MPSNSIFGLFTAGLACFAGIANAYTQPTGSEPVGNPFSQPGLNSVVPVGKPFTVTWKPTTDGTVSIILLKGPANNLAVVGPIAEEIDNSGSFDWTPSTSLAPGQTGYGLQLIVDSTGQYQYTTQFGISNPDYTSSNATTSSSSYAASSTSSGLSYMVAGGLTSSPAPHYNASSATLSTSIIAPSSAHSSSYAVYTTHASNASTTYSAASGSYTAPASATYSTTPSTTTAVHTGGASGLTASLAGLVVAAGVAVLAL